MTTIETVYRNGEPVATIITLWGFGPTPPCPTCGSCCDTQPDFPGLCAGAYEGLCHKTWERFYGPIPEEQP